MIKQIREDITYEYENFKIKIRKVNDHLDQITIMGDHSIDYFTFENFEEAEEVFNKLKEIKEEINV